MRGLQLVGKKFGRLTVLSRSTKNSGGNYYWWCRCECGRLTRVVGGSLTSGHTVSCGCFQGWPKGVPYTGDHKGERNNQAKLTADDVKEIFRLRASGMTQRAIGELFGVIQGTISHVLLRRNWSHVDLTQ